MSRKIFYHYGVIGAGKSTEIQRSVYQYESKGFSTLVLKPSFDTRDGQNVIYSRQTGKTIPCRNIEDYIFPDDYDLSYKLCSEYHIVFVDEVQFCSVAEIKMLDKLAKDGNIRIVVYGLYKDFKDEFWESTALLDKIAGVKTAIPAVCEACGCGAEHNIRLDKYGNIVKTGEQNVLGGTESGLPSYITLCSKCKEKKDIGNTLREKFNKLRRKGL